MSEQSDEQVVWKVCREEGGKLFSCFAWGKSRLEYKEGEWVEAPVGTKLFAFKDFESAMDFIMEYSYITSTLLFPLKASAEGIEPAPATILPNLETQYLSTVGAFWLGTRGCRLRCRLCPTPPRTVLCDKVKLERTIQ